MSYTFSRRIAVAVITLYFVVGMSNEYIGERVFSSGYEWYPVFSWDLFSFVPNRQYSYHMEVEVLGATDYEPALAFREMGEYFSSKGVSPTEYTPLIKELGYQLYRGSGETRSLIDSISEIFGEQRYQYTIYYVEYDPVEYWRHGTYVAKEKMITIASEK